MIARTRESMGLTQSEAAERCNVKLEVYQQVERGQEDFDIILLEVIAKGLGLRYEDIRLDHDPKQMC